MSTKLNFVDYSEQSLKRFALSVGERCKKVIESSPYVKNARTPVTIGITSLSSPDRNGYASFTVMASFKFGKQNYQRDELKSSIRSSLSSIESYIKTAPTFRSGEFKNVYIAFPLDISASGSDCKVELMKVKLLVDKELDSSSETAYAEVHKDNEAFNAIKHLVWNLKSYAKDSSEQSWKKSLGRIDPKLAADLSRHFAEGAALYKRVEALRGNIKKALPKNFSI